MNTKLVRGAIVLGVFLILPLIVVGTITGLTLINLVNQEPIDMSVEILAPQTVAAGNEFTIEVIVENREQEPQILDSIDVGSTFSAGFEIREVIPPYEYTSSMIAEFQSFFFKQEIEPGETLTVTFNAVATQAGEYAGEIAVCINTGVNCAIFNGVLVVE